MPKFDMVIKKTIQHGAFNIIERPVMPISNLVTERTV
jgi:hypothetical protein